MVQMATVVFGPSGHVLSWGWFSIELANLLIIVTMVVLFVVAILVPFGRAHVEAPGPVRHTDGTVDPDGHDDSGGDRS